MRNLPSQVASPSVTIRVSGCLFEGHLACLDHLVSSAIECGLWPVLDLAHLKELDRAALTFFSNGEGRHFGIVACPGFIREWVQQQKQRDAA